MTGLRKFVIANRDDAFAIIRARFSDSSCRMAEKYLHNPLSPGEGAGDIAYEEGRPVGFQAAILRQLYLGLKAFKGIVGGMLAMLPDASPVLLLALMKASIASRDGSNLFFANTSNFKSMQMNRMLGVKGCGPATCERIRFAIVYMPLGFRWLCLRPHARRLMAIDHGLFGEFWKRYRDENKGLVSSRSPEELEWIFGDRIKSGEVVILGEFVGSSLAGYVALKVSNGGRRWMIVDWIALKNDQVVLASLLKSSVRFLRRETNSVMLETIGFPVFVEHLLRKYLPFSRKTVNNTFIWKFLDGQTQIPDGSWFFGPYDGDRCM